jgi:hypothetical protein
MSSGGDSGAAAGVAGIDQEGSIQDLEYGKGQRGYGMLFHTTLYVDRA